MLKPIMKSDTHIRVLWLVLVLGCGLLVVNAVAVIHSQSLLPQSMLNWFSSFGFAEVDISH